MSEFQQPKSFRHQPEEIEIDLDGQAKKIAIKDLRYGKEKALFEILVKIWFQNVSAQPMGRLFEQQAIMRMDGQKDLSEVVQSIQNDIVGMIANAKEDQIKAILSLCTDGQVTSEDVDMMGAMEVRDLVTYLLNRNLESRKNLNASLSTILSQEGQGSTLR